MRKIPTLFVRDSNDMSRLTTEVHPKCGWVADGEGVATRKLDGTCCMVRDGRLYKRREVKPGKPEPEGFEPIETDPKTGKCAGWAPVSDGPEDKWYREAHEALGYLFEGTYELVGPKVQGNPEDQDVHDLVSHRDVGLQFRDQPPRDYAGLRAWMEGLNPSTVDGQVDDATLRRCIAFAQRWVTGP